MKRIAAGRGRTIGMVLLAVVIAAVLFMVFLHDDENAGQTERETGAESSAVRTSGTKESALKTVTYRIRYQGKEYTKKAFVYVPASYTKDSRMDVFYLLHGSGGDNLEFATEMRPLFDSWIWSGRMKPMLVVFPTYYPDDSFVRSDYTEDYPLDHFFAKTEVMQVIRAVEENFSTYARGTSDQEIRSSRGHRAFGGYSMGGVTTWDVMSLHADCFQYFMPMAGDCWLDRVSDADSEDELAAEMMRSIRRNHYGAGDFRILAMVGSEDGTKYSMLPQIRELRRNFPEQITEQNLIYWENEGGSHGEASLKAEVKHGVRYLFTK